ncbi:MAG: anti-sigma factor, partial [Candidatus Aminicenantales bacterium]
MICPHWGVRRKFLSYLEGNLGANEARKVETRLAGCGTCRAAFARIKDGHELAGRLARIEKENAAAGRGFEAAPLFKPAMIEAGQGSPARRRRDGRKMRRALLMAHPRTVWALAAVVIAQAALVAVWKKDVIFGKEESPVASISGIE